MATDPWVITAREMARYNEQFKSLQPVGGVVTGAQAKGFLLQSQLPPAILGQIWTLSDTDADGKMDINEFSIACKLINLKLRGFEIPKTLPLAMVKSLSMQTNTPTNAQPVVNTMPAPMLRMSSLGQIDPLGTMNTLNQRHLMSASTSNVADLNHGLPLDNNFTGGMPVNQTLGGVPLIPSAPLANAASLINTAAPLVNTAPLLNTAPLVNTPPVIPPGVVTPPNQLISPVITQQPVAKPVGVVERSGSISSIDSPAHLEWAVPQQIKLKYTQVFNSMDRTRSGFLSGPQARNIMVQTKLPQNVLASIWSLSDMDNDGKLGCDEFVLAMFLCDQALAGEKVPSVLPSSLIPPTFKRTLLSRHNSLVGQTASATGSPSSADGGDVCPASTLPQTSFEDKRKENYEKGQAELERRRKALLEIQRKEQEERERKEREEAEKREKARLEQERKRQEELERQLQRQKEIEQEKEEQRRRQQEQREAARKEMERQRQMEWENQKLQDLQQLRQKEQENILRLKAQNQSLTIELTTLNDKVKDLSQKICDTRVGVSSVKTTIDGMRTTRDSQVTEMAQLKNKLKDQNARLVIISQEKARLEAKNKMNLMQSAANQEQMNTAFSNKHITLKQLRDKYEDTQKQIDLKMVDIKNNNLQLSELKSHLTSLVEECEKLFEIYDEHRKKVIEMKTSKDTGYGSEWDDNAWDIKGNAWPENTQSTPAVSSSTNMVKYRAVYEFVARNSDEISFQPGDIIMVPLEQNAEPGWLAGEIRGSTGWFPESYVEPVDANVQISFGQENHDTIMRHQLEGIAEVPENTPSEVTTDTYSTTTAPADSTTGEVDYYIASYPYQSTEQGDLTFTANEIIKVIKKEGDWWTGVIDDRTGIFPSNYVQKAPAESVPADNNLPDNSNIVAQDNTSVVTDKTTHAPVSNQDSTGAGSMTPVDSEITQITNRAAASEQHATMPADATPDFAALSANNQTIKSKKPEIVQVIAPYESTSSEQLSLQRGQLIMIRKKTDSGWWEGELQAKGRRKQVGWFPASYVKLLVGGRNSGRNTPVSASKTDMMEQVLDKVIALYPYTAQNEDELSFEKDDIISVTGRDEASWWRGEKNGVTGLFPSNYVGPLTGNP
ncbi:intersectin-1 isoform X2 [Ctenocephalides felis]|uniref:intersectin-1 isoform X2 n=1 Tax=Ctenocephalides felis TaxID=7515 RepID=UPI000E6E4ECB|nr:intersectin-1 isoform X2 [Ctenocephalides felis]